MLGLTFNLISRDIKLITDLQLITDLRGLKIDELNLDTIPNYEIDIACKLPQIFQADRLYSN